jgi:nitrite reductase/ring-hydroxylating ferredoxin subunit
LPAILIGCGFALVVVVVLLIAGVVFAVNNTDFQRGFCNGYVNGDPNVTCPFHPTPK